MKQDCLEKLRESMILITTEIEDSRERAIALTRVQEAILWLNTCEEK